MPELAGIHHVKLPVHDVQRSLAWYERVFGLKVELEFKDDEGVVQGLVGQLPGLNTLLAFRQNPELAEALTGFDIRVSLKSTARMSPSFRSHGPTIPARGRAAPSASHS